MDLLKKVVAGKLADVAGDACPVAKRLGVNRRVKGGLKMSKRILLGLVVMMVGFAGMSYASTDTIKLTITVAPAIDIEVWYLDSSADPDVYAFGSGLGTNDTTLTLNSITVKNASAGLTQDWYIRASDAVGAIQTWSLATTASSGSSNYELRAVLNGASQPAEGDFHVSDDDLTTSNQAMTATNFSVGENGTAVPSTDGSDTRGLWFRINTPYEITDTSEHSIFVTLMATQAG